LYIEFFKAFFCCEQEQVEPKPPGKKEEEPVDIFQTKLTMIYYDPAAKSGSNNSDPPSIETKVASDFIPVNENKHHRPLPTNYLKK
jgi:hypothetical protein